MYRLSNVPNIVIRSADNACIPFDEQNRDYIEYQVWLGLGNTPEAAE